jgi:hypothetical protein
MIPHGTNAKAPAGLLIPALIMAVGWLLLWLVGDGWAATGDGTVGLLLLMFLSLLLGLALDRWPSPSSGARATRPACVTRAEQADESEGSPSISVDEPRAPAYTSERLAVCGLFCAGNPTRDECKSQASDRHPSREQRGGCTTEGSQNTTGFGGGRSDEVWLAEGIAHETNWRPLPPARPHFDARSGS